MLKADSEKGSAIVQEKITGQSIIRYTEFFFPKETKPVILSDKKDFQLLAAVKNKFQLRTPALNKTIKEGQSALIAHPPSREEFIFPGKKIITLLTINYSLELLQNLFGIFPKLEQAFNETTHPSSFGPVQYMPSQGREIIHNILNCYYEPPLREFFYEDQTRDLLFCLLAETTKQAPEIKYLSGADVEKIYAAGNLIADNTSEHYTITRLARKVNLNEFKLKSGFKQIFGVGPFTYLNELRMKKTQELIMNTNKPLKEIASLAGYSSTTAFVTAFKKYFGTTAGSLRKNK